MRSPSPPASPSSSPAPSRPDDLRRERGWRLGLLLGAALLAAVASAVALWVRARLDTSALEDELVRDAARLEAPYPRPIHRLPAAPGSAAERIAEALPALRAAHGALRSEWSAPMRQYGDGVAPAAALPAELFEVVDELAPALAKLLESTRAGAAEVPPEVLDETARGVPLSSVGSFAAVQARRELAAGRVRAAAAVCVDGLAVGRDLSIAWPGLIGRMMGATVNAPLTQVCGDVLNASPREDRLAVAAELRAIRAGTPGLRDVGSAERVLTTLLIVKLLGDPRLLDRLPPAARARALSEETSEEVLQLLWRDAWHTVWAAHGELIEAMAIEAQPERDRAMAAAAARGRSSINPTVRALHLEPTNLVNKAYAAALRLDGLVLLAAAHEHRARSGSWPARVEELAAEGLLLPAEARRLGEAALSREGDALRLTLPLPATENGQSVTLTARP